MTAVEAEWSPVQHLILGEDPQLRVYAEVLVWFKKIELFREGEDQRMILRKPTTEDLAVHRSLLRRLITDGEHLKSVAEQTGLPENFEQIKAQDVSAMLETLRDGYRGWHEPMAPEERQQLLREVFPDVA